MTELREQAMAIAYPDGRPIWLPPTYHAHCWIERDLPPTIVWYAERVSMFREYDDYAMSLGKYMRCRELADEMKGFFDVVVVWGDGLVTVSQQRGKKSDPLPYVIKPGGQAGNEPYVHLSIGGFKEVGYTT
jgi:hypothetical protein